MSQYKVLTAKNCPRCNIVKNFVQTKGLSNHFTFVDSTSVEGKELIQQFKIRAGGTIIDTATNTIVELADIIKEAN